MRAVAPIFLALLAGIAALPAAACEREQAQQSSHSTVTAFLAQHTWAAKSIPIQRLVACKADGAPCAADADCCSGA